MQLPFTRDQFFDLFVAYNGAFWPALVALWAASVVAAGVLLCSRRPPHRWISALLAAHWIWSALAYHVAFFTRINSAAWLFGALFLIQGVALFWFGVVRERLSYARWGDAWAPVAWILIAYSLVYPGLNAIQHASLWRIPAFGVPCPTTILTAGALMLAAPRWRRLAIIPVIWAFIGGSAASLLGVRADYALPIAGVALAIFSTPRIQLRTLRPTVLFVCGIVSCVEGGFHVSDAVRHPRTRRPVLVSGSTLDGPLGRHPIRSVPRDGG